MDVVTPPLIIQAENTEITLRDVLALLVMRWRIIVAVTIAIIAMTILYMAFHTPKYRIDAILTQRLDRDQPERSLGGLSALLGSQPTISDTFLQFLSLLHAPATVEALPKRDEIMETIYADNWDKKRSIWIRSGGLVASAVAWINGLFGLPPWTPPGARDLAEFIGREVTAGPIDRTSIYRISIEWKDPEFGVDLLSALISAADSQIRSRMASELKEREKYLGQELDKSQKLEQRQALARIYADTILSEATLYDTPTYSVQIVQPPTASTRPVSPRPILYCVLGGVGGMVLGIIIVLALAVGRGMPE